MDQPVQGDRAALLSRVLGTTDDWQLRRPSPRPPIPHLGWVGPVLIIASVAVSFLAFQGSNVAFGLWIGAVSILLMAWSFVLAIRIRALEPFFGGLDRMYRVHRWAGTLAILAMFLHTSAEPEIDGGVRGASENLADTAEGLAGVAEIALYILIAISLLRWFPYRWWRLTHKLLGIPFAFACFHFYTAEKTYANNSPWGWWFGAFMIVGLVAYVVRVVGRDVLAPGLRYRVAGANRIGSSLELLLEPIGPKLSFEAGQFAVIKVQAPGLREPHIFTIASAPSDEQLRFFVRDLGDWTSDLHQADLIGTEVIVEAPYGEFEPVGHGRPIVWIAGGVGITPFLSAASTPGLLTDVVPVLYYCVRDRDDAMGLHVLEEAEAAGRLELHLLASSEGNRFDASVLAERFGAGGLDGGHVALCGPKGLVAAGERAARSLGAATIEREDFDIRQGFGPDLPSDPRELLS